MAPHEDWKPLLTTFQEHYGSEADADALFVKFCEGKGINPEEPKSPNVFGFDWSGDVLLEGDWKVFAKEMGVEAEEGMHLVGGRAIHPCKTHHPNEWPEWRIYLEAELAASAATAKGQPFWMDHAIPLGEKNKILAARYFDGELQYVGQVEEYLKSMIERKEIKHISPGFEWTVLEKLNGIAPRGIRYYEFSLLKNLRPGDTSTTVELWEALLGHCVEGVVPDAAYKAVELNQFIENALLDKRILIFHGEVGENICREASKRLEYMASISDDPIKVILNSVGGGVFDGLLVFDTIKQLTNSGIEVLCEARGLAASMGSIILQAGTRRTATPHTRFLIHEVSSWAWGKASSIEEEAEEISKVNMLLKEILAERTGKTTQEIEDIWRKKDVWMSAMEAEEFGLIDEIVSGMVEGTKLKERSLDTLEQDVLNHVKMHGPTSAFSVASSLGFNLESIVYTLDVLASAGLIGRFNDPITGETLYEGKLQEKAFADYTSMDDCIAKNQGKEDPAAYCAETCRKTEALCEALGITMAEFAALGWEGRFQAVADFFEGKMKETKFPIEYFSPRDWLTCPSCGATNQFMDFENLGGSYKCPACNYMILPGTLVEGRIIKEAKTAMFADVLGNDMVICPKCGTPNEKYNWESWGGIIGAGACYICGYEVTLTEIVAYASAEELDVLPWAEASKRGGKGINEATAAQAREHHGLSQEEWDALSEEERKEKIGSVPAAEEGAARKSVAKLLEVTMPAGDAVFSEVLIECPSCHYRSYGPNFEGGVCPTCGYELTTDQLVNVFSGMFAEMRKEKKGFLKLIERMMPAWDAVMANEIIRCPNCTAPIIGSEFSGGVCPNCGYDLGRDELVEILDSVWEAMVKELLRTKALAGEASLSEIGLMSLEIPGYISATLVEAIIPKQLHHKARPGHQRIVRELRALVKRSREVN